MFDYSVESANSNSVCQSVHLKFSLFVSLTFAGFACKAWLTEEMRRPGSTTCRKRTGLDRKRSSWISALNLFTYRIWLWLHMSSHLNWLSYLTCAKFGIAVLVTQWIMVVTSLDSKFFTDRSQPLDWQEPLSSGWLRMAFEFWICGAWNIPLAHRTFKAL